MSFVLQKKEISSQGGSCFARALPWDTKTSQFIRSTPSALYKRPHLPKPAQVNQGTEDELKRCVHASKLDHVEGWLGHSAGTLDVGKVCNSVI